MSTNRRIKVLILLPNLVGAGGQRAILNLYRSLDPSRFELSLLAQEKIGIFLQEIDDKININFILDREYQRTDLPYLLAETIRHARSADLILGGLEGRATFFGLVAAKLLRKPIIVWLHIDWSPFLKLVSWRQKLSLKAYTFADRIIACSQGVADSFPKIVSVDPSRLQAIYNGIPSYKVLQNAEEPLPDSVRGIFEKPTVIMVGRLDPQKGYDYLIEAHAILIRKGIQHNLIIIGEGELLEQLQQQVANLGVSNSVHFLGFQHNPHKFMKHATVFALSSRFEGFGLVLAEALFCGTPIVSTDCPSGPSEILEGGKYGILVKPEDPQALAEGIETVLCDEAKREHLAKLSRLRSETFDERKIAAKWEALFEELVK
jgi:glycosyltransferase involved in cell wall biosynthesis